MDLIFDYPIVNIFFAPSFLFATGSGQVSIVLPYDGITIAGTTAVEEAAGEIVLGTRIAPASDSLVVGASTNSGSKNENRTSAVGLGELMLAGLNGSSPWIKQHKLRSEQ